MRSAREVSPPVVKPFVPGSSSSGSSGSSPYPTYTASNFDKQTIFAAAKIFGKFSQDERERIPFMSDEELRKILMTTLGTAGERRAELEEYLKSRNYPGF